MELKTTINVVPRLSSSSESTSCEPFLSSAHFWRSRSHRPRPRRRGRHHRNNSPLASGRPNPATRSDLRPARSRIPPATLKTLHLGSRAARLPRKRANNKIGSIWDDVPISSLGPPSAPLAPIKAPLRLEGRPSTSNLRFTGGWPAIQNRLTDAERLRRPACQVARGASARFPSAFRP